MVSKRSYSGYSDSIRKLCMKIRGEVAEVVQISCWSIIVCRLAVYENICKERKQQEKEQEILKRAYKTKLIWSFNKPEIGLIVY